MADGLLREDQTQRIRLRLVLFSYALASIPNRMDSVTWDDTIHPFG